MTALTSWTPRDGDTVHLRFDNNPRATGRYKLAGPIESPANGPFWRVTACKGGSDDGELVSGALMWLMAGSGILTPIDPAEIERDRKALELRTLAPLRGRRPVAQSDVDGLALFDAHRSPELEF